MRRAPGPIPLLVLLALAVLYISPTMAYLTYDAPKEFILLVGAVLLLGERIWRSRGNPDREPSRIDAPYAMLALLLVLLAIAALRAYDGVLAARRLGVFVAGAVLFVEARLRFRNARALPLLLGTLGAVGAVVAIYGLLQWFGAEPFAIESNGRAVSTLGNPNFAGSMLILLIPGAAALALTRRGWPRGLAAAALVLMVAHLAVTKNRAGYLGIAAATSLAAGLWLAGRISRPILRRGIVIVAAALPALAGLGLALIAVVLPAHEPLPVLGRVDTIRIRSLIWSGTAEMVRDEPILGQGLGDFMAEYPPVRPREEFLLSLHREVGTPHNDPLELAAEAGPLAGLLYVALIVLILGAVIRRLRAAPEDDDPLVVAALGAILGLATAGLFSSPLSHPGHVAVLFVLLGAVAARRGPIGRAWSLPPIAWPVAAYVLGAGLLAVGFFSYRHLRCESALQASQKAATGNRAVFRKLVNEAVSWSPRHPEALFLAGLMNLKEADLARNPDAGGDAKIRAQKLTAARDRFERILRRQPHHVRALTSLGRTEIEVKNYDEAMVWYGRAMDVNPDYVPLLSQLATVYAAANRHGEAAKLLEHACNVAPEPVDVYPFYIDALVRAGDVPTAVEETKKFIARLREIDRAHAVKPLMTWLIQRAKALAPHLRALALRWAGEGRFEDAEPLLAALVVNRAASGEVWSALEAMAREREDLPRAQAYLVNAKLVYATDAARDKDLDMARRHLAIAESRGAPEYEVLFVRGMIEVQSDDLNAALETLEKAAEAGFWDMDRITSDSVVFFPIAGTPQWQDILIRIQGNR